MWFRKKKLRVLTVGSVPPEWGGLTDGGVAVVHAQVVTALSSPTESVSVAGVIATNARTINHNVPGSLKVLSPPLNSKDEKKWYFDVLGALKPDCVVFFHIAHRWAKYHAESTVPMVGAIHSWHQVTQTEEERSLRAKLLLSQVIPRCDSLVFPSRYTVEEGKEIGFSYVSPVHIAHNPLAEPFAHAQPVVPENLRKVSSVASVGALEPRKRMDFVVRGSRECDAEAIIIGQGSEKQRLMDVACQLGWSDRTQFHDRVSQCRIVELLSNKGVFACPSTSESFGNVYIEALACGLPVVGFEGTFNEIEEKMGMRIGVPLAGSADFEMFCVALGKVLSERWDRQALSQRAKEIFTPENTLAEYVSAIKSAVE